MVFDLEGPAARANLLAAVHALRPNDGAITCDEAFSGGEYEVYRVGCSSARAIAVRIPRDYTRNQYIVPKLREETALIQELNAAGFRWAPTFLGVDYSDDNSLGTPYMLLSWMDGKTLGSSAHDLPPRPVRTHIIQQLAGIQAELIARTVRKTIAGKEETATQRVVRLDRQRRERILAGHAPGVTLADMDALTTRVSGLVDASMDHIYVIDQGDASGLNILSDDAGNLTALIDYGFAERTPLQFAVRWPRLLSRDSPSQYPISPTMRADRKVYLSALRTMHGTETEDGVKLGKAAMWILRVLDPTSSLKDNAAEEDGTGATHDGDDADAEDRQHEAEERVWILYAAHNLRAHRELVNLGWKLPR